MPSIRKKFAGFIRQFSNPSTSDCLDSSAGAHPPKSLSNLDSSGCFIQRYLQGESRLKQPDILFGRTGQELPCLRLCSLQNHVVAAHTGPDSGLTSVNQASQNAHVTSLDPDVSYIDSDDEPNASAALSTPPGRGKGVSTATSDMVTIRAMGQTFRVRNQLPIIRVSSVTKATSCNNSNMNDNNNYTEKKDVASVTATAHSEPLDAALSTIVEEIPSPISSSSPDEDSVAVSLVAGDTTCADQSDYQDFLSKFGILSLSLNVNETTRHSIAKIDSPNDDTLVSGSTSLCVSEVASPVLESFPELTPEPLSLPTPTEQWTGQRPSSLNCSPAAQTVDHQQQDPSASRPVDESTPIEPPTPDPAGPAGVAAGVRPKTRSEPSTSTLGNVTAAAAAATAAVLPSTAEESTPGAAGSTRAVYVSQQETEPREMAGITNWNRPCGMAFGTATSLYERHPVDGEVAGNPVADAFAVVARSNNALLALADGVNWGERAALAARSAIHGCIDYLNRALFSPMTPGRNLTTNDIFLSLLRSFHAAHSLILQEGGLLTTLTAAVVAEVDRSSNSLQLLYSGDHNNVRKFVVCVCNVGDSLAYVYSPKYGVREITQGSHDVHSMRDMRDALGALGPVDGQNPELNNLTCSLTIIDEGDIVFLTSDGISDNFDPVVGKFVVARKPSKINTTANGSGKPLLIKDSSRSLPTVEAFQRHELTLLRMEDILRNGLLPSSGINNNLKAKQLCEDLVDFATRLTSAKRHLLEDVELYVDENGEPLDKEEQKIRRRKICERLALIPGKLDHATVVAYEAGDHPPFPSNEVQSRDSVAGQIANLQLHESVI